MKVKYRLRDKILQKDMSRHKNYCLLLCLVSFVNLSVHLIVFFLINFSYEVFNLPDLLG